MSREKKQSFMGGVTVMAISTVFVKICGALYKIPLNNILGDEGVTHFMSAYNIYAFLLTEGFRHTRSAPRYARRLFLMGALAQIPYAVTLNAGF